MKYKTFVSLLLFFTVMLFACSKDNNPLSQADINENGTLSNSSNLNREITPYKFERINEQNFHSQGWSEEQSNRVNGVNVITTSTEHVEIVCGPENNTDPRLIRGCATMNFPTSADPTLGLIRLRKGGYSGTRLADLTEFKYSTYVVHDGPAVMVLTVDVTGDNKKDFNIFFEPLQRSQGSGYPPLVLNTWQQWNALAGTWGVEFRTVPGLPITCTIAQLVALYPNARLMDLPPVPGTNNETLRFTLGSPEFNQNTIGYVDALIIGTKNDQVSTLYDFTCSQRNQ